LGEKTKPVEDRAGKPRAAVFASDPAYQFLGYIQMTVPWKRSSPGPVNPVARQRLLGLVKTLP